MPYITMTGGLQVSRVVQTTIRIIHYGYPLVLFLGFFLAQAVAACTLASARSRQIHRLRWLLAWYQVLIIATFVAEATVMISHSVVEQGYWSSQDEIIYLLVSIFTWGTILASVIDTEKPAWYPYYGTLGFALVAETCLLALSACSSSFLGLFEILRFSIGALRVLLFVSLSAALFVLHKKHNLVQGGTDEESTRLLVENHTCTSYGSTGPAEQDSDDESDAGEAKAKMKKKIEESGNWWHYAKSFTIFWPYIWPKNDGWLQASMVLVGLCLLLERGLNVLVPHQLGVVTTALSKGSVPWFQVSLFVMFRYLDSGAGVSALQTYLWMPIDQYAYRTITRAAYNHVMLLSHDFHSNKKTADLYTSVTQGRSINGLIDGVLFSVLPMLTDLCIAFAYFFIVFDVYMALIVAVVSVLYIWVTTKLGSMRNQIKRDLNKAARDEANLMWESMSSWTTVSYFNRISYEQNRYGDAIRKYQLAERNWLIGLSLLNVSQSLVFTLGLLAACFLAVYQVSKNARPVGSFVTLLSYWAQLSSPLSFFAGFYRRIQVQMLDAERLLELFQTKPTVDDKGDAKSLDQVRGEITFDNVNFSYDPRKPTLQGLSFNVLAGTKVALVGETGGGKTTCLKLLFRFYDVISGSIRVDGEDIRNVTLSSLRSHMGVVPQDPQLFNDTIMNNLKYANLEATDEEVYRVCRAASIHDKISSFPDGYLTVVGERGVRLSGGELQRVAIARAMLKNPKIILLDEATSMVDMGTERQIQSAFDELEKGRTTIVVAHRLSTIMNSDLILVIGNGRLLEKGTHDDLIQAKGEYHKLWTQQIQKEALDAEPSSQGCPMSAPQNPQVLVNDTTTKNSQDEMQRALSTTRIRFHSTDSESADQKQRSSSDSEMPGATRSTQGRTNPPPTVTFNLDHASMDAPSLAVRPLVGSRNAMPTQGILKSASSSKTAVVPRNKVSALKPDAKEFIPHYITAKQAPTVIPAYVTPIDGMQGGCNQHAASDPGLTLDGELSRNPIAKSTPDSYKDHEARPKPKKSESMHRENLQIFQEKIKQAKRRTESKREKQKQGPITAATETPEGEENLEVEKAPRSDELEANEVVAPQESEDDVEDQAERPKDGRKTIKRRRNRRRPSKPKIVDSPEETGTALNQEQASSSDTLPLATSRPLSDRKTNIQEGDTLRIKKVTKKPKSVFRKSSEVHPSRLELENEELSSPGGLNSSGSVQARNQPRPGPKPAGTGASNTGESTRRRSFGKEAPGSKENWHRKDREVKILEPGSSTD